MMRLVALLALVAVALAQDDDGSYSADKYENPYAYSEQQAAAAPQYQPQAAPQYQPQQYQPQAVPQYQPTPQYQPAPQYQPVPQYQPQAVPQYQPQVQYRTAAAPQAPQYQQAAAGSLNAIPQTSTNYKTQDHERFENVDGQGNVQGQYSYVDPNGKTITVKYTAGKDGFQVEGDHLPRAPVPGAAPAAPAAAPAAPAYQQQPRYFQPAAPAAPAPVYEPRYQQAAAPVAPAAPGRQPQQQLPASVAQFFDAPLGHRFAGAPAAPAY